MKKIFDIDFLGMCASVLCLIHCLFLPWLVALAGVYFGAFFESPNFHNIMLVVAILIGLPVFIISFVRYKSKLILASGLLGLSLTTLGTMKSDNCCPPVSTEAACAEGSECAAECSTDIEPVEVNENIAEAEDQKEITEIQGFNTVPVGVSFLILAHFLNFRKRKSCENVCCS